MSADKMPPLPERYWPRAYFGSVPSGAFTADQMRAYARAYAAEQTRELVESLKETLLFCETFSNRWDGQTGAHPFGMVNRARALIAKHKEQA